MAARVAQRGPTLVLTLSGCTTGNRRANCGGASEPGGDGAPKPTDRQRLRRDGLFSGWPASLHLILHRLNGCRQRDGNVAPCTQRTLVSALLLLSIRLGAVIRLCPVRSAASLGSTCQLQPHEPTTATRRLYHGHHSSVGTQGQRHAEWTSERTRLESCRLCVMNLF